MMLADRVNGPTSERVCLCEDVRACACRGAERCENVGEKKQTKGGRERSIEQEMMIAEGEVWSGVGSKIGQETAKKSNERFMMRKKCKSSNGVE